MTHSLYCLFAVDQSILNAANHLAMVVGLSAADGDTYVGLDCQDADGVGYAVACFSAAGYLPAVVGQPLSRPAWDTDQIVDMDLVEQARQSLRISSPGEPVIPAAPGFITGRVCPIDGFDANVELALLGLTRVPAEEPPT